jgi:hypothetical protein
MCSFWGHGLVVNKWLMEHNWLNVDWAVKLQSWLINRVSHEHKLACQAHMRVLETCFLTGELAASADNLNYFYDLRSLYIEGRYDILLVQLYQLDSKSVTEDEDDNDTVLYYVDFE